MMGWGSRQLLTQLKRKKIYHCLIKYEDNKFKFYFEDKYWDRYAGDNPSWGYMLNPFIGGVFTLEHDWKIDIYDIKKGEEDSLQAFEPRL